jgi:short-subunit dehydrogenase involved in D-alanine esterification of teichoic acids
MVVNLTAALHSFTMSLRHQLKGTSAEVVEIVPPQVDTDMGRQFNGMDLDLYTNDLVKQVLFYDFCSSSLLSFSTSAF